MLLPDETGLGIPVFSLVGGKWTSFRAFSEQVTDRSLAFLGRKRLRDTKGLCIGGGHGYPETGEDRKARLDALRGYDGLPAEQAARLLERYGSSAEEIASYLVRLPDEPLKNLPSYSRRELAFIAEHEKVVHLDDLLLRRSMLAMLGRLSRAAVQEIAEVLGKTLGWDAGRVADEARRSLNILTEVHGARL